MGHIYFKQFLFTQSNLNNMKMQSNAAFTLNSFDDQERYLTFAKAAFQVLKLNILLTV